MMHHDLTAYFPACKARFFIAGLVVLVALSALPGCGQSSEGEAPQAEADAADARGVPLSEWGRAGWPAAVVIEDAEQAFDRLTRTAWGMGSAQTISTSVQFRRDGTFNWVQMPGPPCGTPDFQRSGPWTLRWHGTHGQVVLQGGSIIAVQFRGEQLFFGGSLLSPGEVIEYDDAAQAKTLADLPEIEPDGLHARLIAHDWRKSNSYYLSMYPDALSFAEEGRCYAGYRGGEDGYGAFWSVIVERGHDGLQATLLTAADENRCDIRNPEEPGYSIITHADAVPRFDGDLMMFYGSCYLPADSDPNLNVFSFDRYSHTVRVIGSYEGDLRPGVTTPMTLRLVQNPRDEYYGRSLRVYQVPDEQSGLTDRVVLAEIDMGGRLMAHRYEVEVTPVGEGDGPISFMVELEYENSRQAFHGYRAYSTND